MTTTRLFRTSKPPLPRVVSSSSTVRCVSSGSNKQQMAGFNGDQKKRVRGINGDDKRKSTVKASVATWDKMMVITTKPKVDREIDLASLLAKISNIMLKMLRELARRRRRTWNVQIIQMFIEKVIVGFRFFTLLAVAGSLLGSVLCFVEGSFLILESYFQFFQKADQGHHVVHLIIEAIDTFLVGTAMFTFGVGLYVMFVGTKNNITATKGACHRQLPVSNLFGLFNLKTLPKWVQMKSVSEAKSKMGHAVMMILQVGVLEKVNSIPIVTSLDLLCFAGTVVVSSACVFLLSKLSVGNTVKNM